MNNNELLLKRNATKKCFIDKGLNAEDASFISDCLYTADLYGVTSHGLNTAASHLKHLDQNSYNLYPNFKITRETSSFAVIDGDNAIGFLSARYALLYAIEKAEKTGVFSVFSFHNNTFGPAFYYSYLAAKKGYIAFVSSNAPAQMALMNGSEKMLGTNPFSMVIPVPGDEPIIIDMASSIVAKSKFNAYKENGQSLPDGWALDKNGKPTNNPQEAIDGFVMPMGGIKGLSISLMIDVVCGVLSGANYLNNVGHFYSNQDCMNVGFFISVFNPNIIIGEQYNSLIHDFVKTLRESKTCDGCVVSLPGDDRLLHKKQLLGQTKKD